MKATPYPTRVTWAAALYCLLIITVAFTGNLKPVWDPDSYWHLAVSKQSFETGTIVSTAFNTFEAPEREWTDVDWLVHFVYYPVYEYGGYRALELFTAAIAGLIALVCFLAVMWRGGSPTSFLLFLGLFFTAFAGRIRLRPESLSLLLFSLLVLLLAAFDKEKVKRTSYMFFLFAIFFLWTQIHPAWAYGLVLLFIHEVYGYLSKGPLGRESILRPICALAVSSAALFLNPFGSRLVFFPFQSLFGFVSKDTTKIVEWQSSPWEITTVPFLAASLSVSLYYSFKAIREKYLSIELLVSTSQFLLLAVWVRYCSFAFIALAPLCVPILDSISGKWKIAKYSFYLLIPVLLLSPLVTGLFYNPTEVDQAVNYPVKECDFIAANQISGNVLHNFVSGGYIGFRLYPRGKIFFDGRYYPFLKELKEFDQAGKSPSDFKTFSENHDFDIAILPYFVGDKRNSPTAGSVVRYIFPREKWAPVYYGPYGMVLLRREPPLENIIDNSEYKVLYPDEMDFLKRTIQNGQIDKDAVLKELQRAGQDGGPVEKWMKPSLQRTG